MVTGLRRAVHDVRMKLLRVRPVADCPYATHLPVLIGLARVRRIRRVLELGSGIHSTPLFLNKQVYPDLDFLVSLEDDPAWFETVRSAAGHDSRLDLRKVAAVSSGIPADISEFDLIFVDDSRTCAERTSTIVKVHERIPSGIVAIHDFEQRSYRRAARLFAHHFVFGSLTPQVGVVWSDADVDHQELLRLRALISLNVAMTPSDIQGWHQALSCLMPSTSASEDR